MILRRINRTYARRTALPLMMLILAATAAGALAATFSGDGTFVGTSASDTFNLGSGNDTAYGLAGKDTFNVGNGNDVLDGDGDCMQGSNSAAYCEHGPIAGDGGDTFNVGNGNDTLYGGGGKNTYNVGNGTDVIYGGPLGDTFNLGNGNYTVYLGAGGGNTVNLGSKAGGVVYAQNDKRDTVNCKGDRATVYADRGADVLNSCKNVIYTHPAATARKRAARKHHATVRRPHRHR